ncbi:MAG: sugar phosphate isomerase/epimerase [Eubacteriales bacterium]|jgi:sugar phosphate isomerase/epimerase|nr:sugar phosphate isomerase/epimerase [Eubacteriales bacterium]MDD3110282.1 sugar phosphate isomerase/epimerase [Eubacteriales bacterium]MDD3572705.1 sugar phosphate isomerase/epimerase [Eubacteriales bacterium]MDD4134729.1 sugar phosphate isomerase/epimerase [Eubacteriales bacterium]NLO12564.1 sugar phosphate isomerase/epimerase [Clostridiales bacterium]
MILSVFSVVLGGLPFAEACRFLSSQGVDAVEIGCGGNPGKQHCDPRELLGNRLKQKEFLGILSDNGLKIAALSCHGNPVHPDPQVARDFHEDFEDAVRLAAELGVDRVVTFSGCPGGSQGDQTPNWVTCAWPDDFQEILSYQWDEVLIPYWQKEAAFVKSQGIGKVALEMHPGFCVYNPETLLRLRKAAGEVIGANLDPSHLFWQGIDTPRAIRALGKAIHFFHAKDTSFDLSFNPVNGVLDYKHYSHPERSWVFRTVGYGHGQLTWNQIISALRQAGYDGPVSIEHEDALMSGKEGLTKAIRFLKDVLMTESAGEMTWA